jgi:type I restriction enzyme S subunit
VSEPGLPEDWTLTPLSELLESLESGSRPRGGVRGILEGVPSVGGEHLNSSGGFNFESIKYVPRSFFEGMRRGHIRQGDVLIVKDGATTGKVSLVRADFPYTEAVANEHVFVCRPKGVSSEYLFWFLHSPEGQRRILEHFRGSAQGGITQEFASGTYVVVAPRAVQDLVASVLETVDGKRTTAQSRLASTLRSVERFRQAVLIAACAGRLTADWRIDHDLPATSDRLAELRARGEVSVQPPNADELGELPSTWAWASLGEVGRVQLGGTPSRKNASYWNGGVPWVSSGEVANCRIAHTRETITDTGLANSSAKLYPAGTVLIAMIGEGKTRGQAAILDIEASTNQNAAGIVSDTEFVSPEYVWRWALAQYEVTRAVGRGGNQPALNKQKVGELSIPIPPLDEQREIVLRVDQLLALADSLEQRIGLASRRVERSSQSILAKAFRGELSTNGALREFNLA